MTTEEYEHHISRATHAIALIAHCEATLDRIFFSRQTVSIAPPPENFFNSYADEIYAQVKKAKEEYAGHELDEKISFPSNYSEIIGNRIKEQREKQGLTQKELAELTGIRRPNIARLERGQSLPNLSTLVKISVGLSLSIEQMLKY